MKEYGHEFAEFLYYTPSEFEKLGGVWPVRAGRNIAKPNYQVGPKVIECFSLHFVASGSLLFTYGDETVRLTKGDLFCLYPNLRYSYRVEQEEAEPSLRMYWLAFDGNQAEGLLERTGLQRKRPYVPGVLTTEHETLITQIQRLFSGKSEHGVLELQSLLFQLFAQLSRHSPGFSSDTDSTDWLGRSIRYMNTHYMEGISVADVVEVAGVHRSHVYSECVRLLGISPRQYLNKLRMEKGADLLLERKMTVTEISLSLGYPDLFSFSRAFCKYFGVAPTSYRKVQATKVALHI